MRIVRLERSAKLIAEIANRGAADTARVEPAVRRIVNDVRKNGDSALMRYARKLDRLQPGVPLRVSAGEMRAAWESVDSTFKAALKSAARNIERFARWQMPQSWMRSAGDVRLGQAVQALDSVGCYVPGGRYPLPSTVLMTVVPAKVAGVSRIVVVSPNPALETLAAAHFLGVEEIYRVGGAQAIAALAYGTEKIAPVAKIVGPGNIYVTTAKKLVAFDCGIDMLAGPTEAVMVSDRGNPQFLAADLVAQAEHDPETFVAFFTTRRDLANAVQAHVTGLSKQNPIARTSLDRRGYIFLAKSLRAAVDAANAIAPEHITVDENLVGSVTSAGSIFVGDYSAQSFGDYATGPNHVLPTGGLARVRGGLSVTDYVKIMTVQHVSKRGAGALAEVSGRMADAEGLVVHAYSARLRGPRA